VVVAAAMIPWNPVGRVGLPDLCPFDISLTLIGFLDIRKDAACHTFPLFCANFQVVSDDVELVRDGLQFSGVFLSPLVFLFLCRWTKTAAIPSAA